MPPRRRLGWRAKGLVTPPLQRTPLRAGAASVVAKWRAGARPAGPAAEPTPPAEHLRGVDARAEELQKRHVESLERIVWQGRAVGCC